MSALDHEWIRARLGWPLRGDEPISIRSISHSLDLMGSVARVSCAGNSFIFKGPPDDLSAWGNLLPDMGLREVETYRFLQSLGPGWPKISPDCHWSTLSEDGKGAIALEDLGPQRPPHELMAPGLPHSQALAAVHCLATVHSTLAETSADPFSQPFPWMYSASSAGLIGAIQMGLDNFPHLARTCWPELAADLPLDKLRQLDVEAEASHAFTGANCLSLCHGDAWASNFLFTAATDALRQMTAFLIDWQFTTWGNPLSDFAFLLLSSLTPASREAWEYELLLHYHATLTAHCAIEYPLSACLDDFRRAEPFAAVVALATMDGFTNGMSREELSGFATRMLATMDIVAGQAGSTADNGPAHSEGMA